MTKCIFALYHNINVDGRSAELVKCAMMIGDTILVSYEPYINKPDGLSEIIVARGKRNYIRYLNDCKKIIKREKPDFLFLENNYDAPLISFAKKINPKIKIVYDVSELYIESAFKTKNLTIPINIRMKQKLSRFLSYAEAKNIRMADVITIPSRERALIFKGYHRLNEIPVVFDNIHRLDDSIDYKKYDSKYNYIDHQFVVIYGGGIADSRYTYELCSSIAELGEKFLLLICGAASEYELKRFNDWKASNFISNVKYLGMLKKDEWRYLIQKSHITFSAYKYEDMNMIFCASGKVYEGLFEGKPLLASKNPPFESLCTTYGIGIATEDFSKGVVQIKENYQKYCDNVTEYVKQLNFDERIQSLKESILKRIMIGNDTKL